jgi:hypothetical protein
MRSWPQSRMVELGGCDFRTQRLWGVLWVASYCGLEREQWCVGAGAEPNGFGVGPRGKQRGKYPCFCRPNSRRIAVGTYNKPYTP